MPTKIPNKHLIVDAFNIIHAWPELKRELKENMDLAQQHLIDILSVIHDTQDIRLTIVFDGNGNDIEVIHPTEEATLGVLYSPKGMTADTLIESLTANNIKKKKEEITVATQDTAVAMGIQGLGATPMSPTALKEWVNTCQNQQSRHIREHNQKSARQWKQKP